MGKFEIFKTKDEWYFRLKAANGEIVASSEGYKTKQGAMKGVASVQKNAKSSQIIIIDKDKKEMKPKQLVKELVKQEKDYMNPKTTSVKSEDEIKDEKKVLVSGPIKSWKTHVPVWM